MFYGHLKNKESVQVIDQIAGNLQNWREVDTNVVVVGSRDIFSLHKLKNGQHHLHKIKPGKTLSSSDIKQIICFSNSITVDGECFIITVSANGALYK